MYIPEIGRENLRMGDTKVKNVLGLGHYHRAWSGQEEQGPISKDQLERLV